jgi:tRNA threonylcarbamoyladenosine biosynthesis protein TsaE
MSEAEIIVTEEGSEVTRAPQETRALGIRLAARLGVGDMVAFHGDLGTGKTCMIQGVCAGLGVDDTVNSPTFILIKQYQGHLDEDPSVGEGVALRPHDHGSAVKGPVTIQHLDLYRLAGPADLADLGAEEIFYSDDICLVEWAERGEDLLPLPRWEVQLCHRDGDEREISWRYLMSARSHGRPPVDVPKKIVKKGLSRLHQGG